MLDLLVVVEDGARFEVGAEVDEVVAFDEAPPSELEQPASAHKPTMAATIVVAPARRRYRIDAGPPGVVGPRSRQKTRLKPVCP